MYHKNILGAIGKTPLVKLNKVTKGVKATVLAKVEFFNPGNSIKDRMAIKMVEEAEQKGWLKPGGTIVEGTSGNTGMGLAICAIVKGYKCIFTTTDKQSKEKIDVMKAMGAEVIVCPTDVESDDPRSYYSTSKRIAEETPNSFYVNQYDNLANTQAHYETTGPEIWEQTEGKITHLVVGAGTGGTISGCGRFLKQQNPNIKVWAIDTYGSALKKYHETGKLDPKEVYSYITEGIGEDIIPKNLDFSVIDLFEKVTDKDGAVMARRITKEEGIFVGYSAGSAVAGILQMKDQLKESDLVVVVFPDHGSRYVAKLFNDEWMRDRRFLDIEPDAESIIRRKDRKAVVTITKDQPLKEAVQLMRQSDISQIPVTENGHFIGSVIDHKTLSALLADPASADQPIAEHMAQPFPFVELNSTTKEISSLINKENTAVLVKDRSGSVHIITEYDLIQAIAG